MTVAVAIHSWKNVLNQPFFANPKPPTPVTCGVQVKFYDSPITTGQFAPVKIKGPVSLAKNLVKELPEGIDEKGAKGARFAVAFLERNFLDCKELA